jgi:cyanate permease
MLLAMSCYMLAFIWLRPGFVYWFIVGAYGLSLGMFGVLMTLTWPRYYGRTHLGAISGFAMTFMVIFSAMGPAIFGRVLSLLGRYSAAFAVCTLASLILLAFAYRARNPQLRFESRT